MSSDEHFCEKHNCVKTWMIQNSFCPKCEEIEHGKKGKTEPVKSLWDRINEEEPEEKEEEITLEFDLSDLQARWEKQYGNFISNEFLHNSSFSLDGWFLIKTKKQDMSYSIKNHNTVQLPDLAEAYKWYPIYAKWFPIKE